MTPDSVALPCGCFINCVINDGVNEFRISPCRPGCQVLAIALAEAEEQGKPVERRVR